MLTFALATASVLASSGGDIDALRVRQSSFAACMFEKANLETEEWVFEQSASMLKPFPQPKASLSLSVCAAMQEIPSLFPSREYWPVELWNVLSAEKYVRLSDCIVRKGSGVISAIHSITNDDGVSLEKKGGFPTIIADAGRSCDSRYFSLIEKSWVMQAALLNRLRKSSSHA